MPATVPFVQHIDRVEFLLSGVVQSRSDPDRQYRPRFILQTNMLCTCDGSIMQDAKCVHLRATLEALDKEELIEFILAGQTIPPPFGDET